MDTALLEKDLTGRRIHMVGVKGTGMAALAEILVARGAALTGSDVAERFYTDAILERLGIVPKPFCAGNVDRAVELVIHSSAYSPDANADIAEAVRLGVPTLMYTEALGAISRSYYSVGVCGVHGKTTTTGMAGTILRRVDLASGVLAGSAIASFGSSCVMMSDGFLSKGAGGEAKYFVAETCEYKRHFMAFSPRVIALTSVESDHQDYYPDYASIRDAFVDYACKLPTKGVLIYCADDAGACDVARLAQERRADIRLVPYGHSAGGSWHVSDVRVEGGRQVFSVAAVGPLSLRVPGEHNVLNAAAAMAIVHELLSVAGKDLAVYKDIFVAAMDEFAGAKRRSEIVAKRHNSFGDEIIFVDDYAHHPTAIRTTLSGYRSFWADSKLVVDFMSHTYSRTQALFDEFAQSFAAADLVVINEIYSSAREGGAAHSVTGEMLANATRGYNANTIFARTFDEAAAVIKRELEKKAGGGWVCVTMGAGDNWKVGQLLMACFPS